MSDRVLEGIDAARRAGWARAYAAERRVAELEEELARTRTSGLMGTYPVFDSGLVASADLSRSSLTIAKIVEHFDTAADYAEEWKRRAQTAETKVALFRAVLDLRARARARTAARTTEQSARTATKTAGPPPGRNWSAHLKTPDTRVRS